MLRLLRVSQSRPLRLWRKKNARFTLKPTEDQALQPVVKNIQKLSKSTEEVIVRNVLKKLKEVDSSTVAPYVAYENVVNLLIKRNRPRTAAAIVEGMRREGFKTSNVLDARIAAVAMSLPQTQAWLQEQLAVQLATIVKDPNYKESDLVDLVQLMHVVQADKNAIALVVASFLDEQAQDYAPSVDMIPAMADMSARAGDTEEAFRLIENMPNEDSVTGRKTVLVAYTQLFTALRDMGAWTDEYVNRLLRGMADRDITLSIEVFNLLLSRAIHTQQYDNVAPLIELLRSTPEDNVLPDIYTFGNIFEMYSILRRSKGLYFRGIEPRRMYCEFMVATKREDRPIIPTQRVMNLIFNAFVRQRDYAGAFVVLRSFAHFRVPLNHQTYYSLVKRIVYRIWKDIAIKRKVNEVKWADCFLGVPFNRVKLNASLVKHILWLVSRDEFVLMKPMYPVAEEPKLIDQDRERERPKYPMPTMQMMESINLPKPLDFVYHPMPLTRLLRRAMLADVVLKLLTMPKDEGAEKRFVSSKGVSTMIAKAKARMLPP